jgi:hypothetical protein
VSHLRSGGATPRSEINPERGIGLALVRGLFTAAYGIAWFLGSDAVEGLYTVSRGAVVAFSIAGELAAIPFLLRVKQVGRAGAGKTEGSGQT